MHVTVIMGVFQARGSIAAAVESIRGQTYSDWDMVIVDDASTDGTWEWLRNALEKDPRITLIRQEAHCGLAAGLNRAWRMARGECIARMDADDVSLPERLMRQVEFMKSHPEISVLGSGARLVTGDGEDAGVVVRPSEHEALSSKIFRQNPFIHPTVMMRKSFLEAMGGYDENYMRAQDYDLWLRAHRRFRFHNLPDNLLIYSWRGKPAWSTVRHGAKALWRGLAREDWPLVRMLASLYSMTGLMLMCFGIRKWRPVKTRRPASLASKWNVVARQIMVRRLVWMPGVRCCVVNEFPKSGGTWLGQMLGDALGMEFPRNRPPPFRSCVLHGHYLHSLGIRNAAIMWRDGRDVMVSLYYHCLFMVENNNEDLVEQMRNKLRFGDYADIRENLPRFMEFIHQHGTFPRFSWAEFVLRWHGRENMAHVHYEDLLKDTPWELNRLLVALGYEPLPEARLGHVVEKWSFQNQTGRDRGRPDAASFLRKGIAGDWKNCFTPDARCMFHRFAGRELILLGYEKDASWVNAGEQTKGP